MKGFNNIIFNYYDTYICLNYNYKLQGLAMVHYKSLSKCTQFYWCSVGDCIFCVHQLIAICTQYLVCIINCMYIKPKRMTYFKGTNYTFKLLILYNSLWFESLREVWKRWSAPSVLRNSITVMEMTLVTFRFRLFSTGNSRERVDCRLYFYCKHSHDIIITRSVT